MSKMIMCELFACFVQVLWFAIPTTFCKMRATAHDLPTRRTNDGDVLAEKVIP